MRHCASPLPLYARSCPVTGGLGRGGPLEDHNRVCVTGNETVRAGAARRSLGVETELERADIDKWRLQQAWQGIRT